MTEWGYSQQWWRYIKLFPSFFYNLCDHTVFLVKVVYAVETKKKRRVTLASIGLLIVVGLLNVADNLKSEDQCLEEEILSVLDVPPGKMGRVIGRKGASILAIKEACKYEPFRSSYSSASKTFHIWLSYNTSDFFCLAARKF